MNIYRNSIGVEISPSALRIACLVQRKGALHISAIDKEPLPYDDFDDLYRHPEKCGDVLNRLCAQHNIQSGECIAAISALRGKSKCVALPMMRRRALLRMLSSKHFWYKHLGVGNDTHSYAWLITVHDKKHYRLSLYLMAVPTLDINFYKTVFARTQLSLNALSFSTLAYYGMHHNSSAHRLLVINESEAYLAHFGPNIFSHQRMLSDNDHQNLFKESCNQTALRHLSESLHEQLRSEQGDAHNLFIAGDLSDAATTQLEVLLKDITLKPLNVCKNIKLAPQAKNISPSMSKAIALAYWLAVDAKTFRHEANFIHNHNTAYYLSAGCWILSTIISAALFFYYQHLAALDAAHHPQLQYQTQLSLEHDEYKKKLKATRLHSKRRQQLQASMQFLSEQHRLANELWSRFGELIPKSIRIQSIDCQWQSACLITATADDYGQIIHFADQIKQMDEIIEVAINSSHTAQDQSAAAMQFTLACTLNNGVDE